MCTCLPTRRVSAQSERRPHTARSPFLALSCPLPVCSLCALYLVPVQHSPPTSITHHHSSHTCILSNTSYQAFLRASLSFFFFYHLLSSQTVEIARKQPHALPSTNRATAAHPVHANAIHHHPPPSTLLYELFCLVFPFLTTLPPTFGPDIALKPRPCFSRPLRARLPAPPLHHPHPHASLARRSPPCADPHHSSAAHHITATPTIRAPLTAHLSRISRPDISSTLIRPFAQYQ